METQGLILTGARLSKYVYKTDRGKQLRPDQPDLWFRPFTLLVCPQTTTDAMAKISISQLHHKVVDLNRRFPQTSQ